MKRQWFLLLPALVPTGPVKGAFALANALAGKRDITLVTLKSGNGAGAPLDPRVRTLSLASTSGFFAKIAQYRKILEGAGGRCGVISLSMCLSADAVNSQCRRYAVTGASVRSNLPQNYRFDYGLPGLAAAWAHMRMLRSFDLVFAMTRAMAGQIRSMAGVDPGVVGNFLDESVIERHRAIAPGEGALRVVFVGSLTARKQPHLALEALQQLLSKNSDVRLEMLGTGPFLVNLQRRAAELDLGDRVEFPGFVSSPYSRIATADAFLLPSHSEGVSRASLEALHLGVPCVLRDVDGNRELITAGTNGEVFGEERGMGEALERAFRISRAQGSPRPNLLPAGFRQDVAARQYLEMLEGVVV